MALVLGTNCGFVTAAPTTDPVEVGTTSDSFSVAMKHDAPSGSIKVIEIGWWCSNSSEEADFDVGIYNHNSGDNNPEDIVGVSRNNAKGTTSGWKVISGLDISITAGTTYWIGVQIDDTASITQIDHDSAGATKSDIKFSQTALPDPWGASSVSDSSRTYAIYALVETVDTGTNMQINIGDTWKDVDALKINIGDTWKDVAAVKQNIGDVWKDVF